MPKQENETRTKRMGEEPMSRYTFKDGPTRWFEFGKTADGRFIDISDGHDDVLSGIPAELGKAIMESHNNVVDALERSFYLHMEKTVQGNR